MTEKRLNKAERALQFLGSLLDRTTRMSWIFSGALIVLLAFVTGYGVVMRYIFKNPDPYAYEISYIIMLACVMFTIAQTQRLRRHLRIDIFDRYMPEKMRDAIINVISPLVGLIICVPLVWKSWEQAMFAVKSSQTTATTGIPVAPMMFTIPVGVGLLCLVLIAQVVRYFASLKYGKSSDEEQNEA
ncbi:MAG: TRAP transporter small permease [Dehalococcoidia bacterium]|jgi:TRAP-type C4-dicarboxylate transport system permease small subunit